MYILVIGISTMELCIFAFKKRVAASPYHHLVLGKITFYNVMWLENHALRKSHVQFNTERGKGSSLLPNHHRAVPSLASFLCAAFECGHYVIMILITLQFYLRF